MNAFVLRPAEPADAAAIAAIYAPYVTDTVITFEEVPLSAEQMCARMSRSAQLPWLVAVQDATVLGYACAAPHRSRAAYRWSVEVSIYVIGSHHGRGIGTALYGRLLPELRDLGYVNAYAGITLPNPASVRLHERMGCTPIGSFPTVGYKHGQWHDVGWWHLPLVDPPAEPPGLHQMGVARNGEL